MLAAALLLAAAAPGDSDARIDELERRLKALEEARAPAPEGRDRFHFGGYASVLYRSPDDPASVPSFEGIRVVPQFSFDVSKGIDFAMEIEFERGGVAEEFLEDSEVIVEYAETRFHVDDAFIPRAGIILVPFLRYNKNHDDPIWNLQDRPFTATRLFTTAFMQPGVAAEGTAPLGGGNTFNYDASLTNGLKDGATEEPFEEGRTPFGADSNHDKAAFGRAGVTPRIPFLDAADLGVSFATGRMSDDGSPTVRMTGWGIDGKLTKGRFDLVGEFGAFHYDRPASQPVELYPRQSSAAFLQLDTRLLRGLPESRNGLVGKSSELILAVRWEYADLNERVTGSSPEGDARALTVGLAFRFTPKTVVRVERKEERTSWSGPGANDRSQWVVSLSTYF